MRIDRSNPAPGQLSCDVSSKQVAAPAAIASGGGSREDHVAFPSDSKSVGSLVRAALHSPAVRQGKVDSLRQAISSGRYQIDPASIAASMVGQST
jgi:flagellar biosynthesis anti-sigma factor FlgM